TAPSVPRGAPLCEDRGLLLPYVSEYESDGIPTYRPACALQRTRTRVSPGAAVRRGRDRAGGRRAPSHGRRLPPAPRDGQRVQRDLVLLAPAQRRHAGDLQPLAGAPRKPDASRLRRRVRHLRLRREELPRAEGVRPGGPALRCPVGPAADPPAHLR